MRERHSTTVALKCHWGWVFLKIEIDTIKATLTG